MKHSRVMLIAMGITACSATAAQDQNILPALLREVAALNPANQVLVDGYRSRGTRTVNPNQDGTVADIVVASSRPSGRSGEIVFRLFHTPASAQSWIREPNPGLSIASLVSKVNMAIPVYQQFPALVRTSDIFNCQVITRLDEGTLEVECSALRPGERLTVTGTVREPLPKPGPGGSFNVTAQVEAAKQQLIPESAHHALLGIQQLRNRLTGMQRFAQGSPPSMPRTMKSSLAPVAAPATRRFGIRSEPVDELESVELGLRNAQGTFVSAVEPGGFAASVGLRAGDIIIAINGQAVSRPDDLTRIQSSLSSGATVRFALVRPGTPPAGPSRPVLSGTF